MSNLIIKNRVINAPIIEILQEAKNQSNTDLLRTIKKYKKEAKITCPFHSDGQEKTPDCFVSNGENDIEFGTFHCFACGKKGKLYTLINKIFDKEDLRDTFGKDWLYENFGSTILEDEIILETIDIYKKDVEYEDIDKYLTLDQSPQLYDYLINKRRLFPECVRYFDIRYDSELNAVVFPVKDNKGNTLFCTKREIDTKKFHIPPETEKPVYLLDEAKKYKAVYVCESQINALTLFGWGFPAVALFGTGSDYQYKLLNSSCISTFYLCFDGDKAGDSGAERFVKNIRKDCLVNKVCIPKGKDVNDLSKKEFKALPVISL